MKRVLLLGGYGFIGAQIRLLFEQQSELLTVTAPRSAELNLVTASEVAWNRLLSDARPDVIVNATGRTSGTPRSLFDTNELLVSRLLTSLEGLNLSPWLVQLGSAAEYGVTATSRPVSEHDPCNPVNDYGVSKLAATQLIQEALSRGAARGVVLRVFNPVGAGQGENTLPGRAARLLREARVQGQPRVTFGSLASSRDYLDVRDVASAVLVAARLGNQSAGGPAAGRAPFPEAASPPVLNVGSGHARRSRELIRCLARLAGFTGEIGEESQGSPRSEVPWQQADVHRLRSLGWTPQFTLEDALQDLWNSLPPPPPVFSSAVRKAASGSTNQ
ncbi:NAD-dependent epimerase/dehydratase family protein [Deinococcus altitudinis]|uniref:NAD-dependent epimerase/dehydratase family protein n=1 Tax=Deinococcus altitudinis TaxID=468914 RepID=UPI0038922139